MHICPTGAIIVKEGQPIRAFRRKEIRSGICSKAPTCRKKSKQQQATDPGKKIIATVSLAGCFGCHMSLLDIDTDLLDVIELVSFDKSPLTDIKNLPTGATWD